MQIQLIYLKDQRRVLMANNKSDAIEMTREGLQWVLDNQDELRRAIRFLDGKECKKCT